MQTVIKKTISIFIAAVLAAGLSGCNKEIQIFEKPVSYDAVSVKDTQLQQEVYYVKNGTRFTPVYMPKGNSSTFVKKLNTSRIMYCTVDENMIPIHYKGELIAYASASADLRSVSLERFKDMGYSIGIYGGKVKEDGYYHINTKDNLAEGSNAQTIFNQVMSSEIRIISIGGSPISNWVDEDTGIIRGMSQDKTYTMEFYAGTYYYKLDFVSDTHFFGAFEVYNYDKKTISDTKNNYMCFNTPETLLSGYYNINGTGLFLYHAYERGQESDNENYNVSYYESFKDIVASYSKQYTVSVPTETKDMEITVSYKGVGDSSDEGLEIGGYVIAPDGTGYEMDIKEKAGILSLTMSRAMAGDWIVNITPQSLNVLDVSIASSKQIEDTTCEEVEFVIEKDTSYQMFYADILGDKTGEVYGSIIGPNGITYSFSIGTKRDENNQEVRYMYYQLPYVKAGTYTVKIYHYLSQTEIKNIQMMPYNNTGGDIFIIE